MKHLITAIACLTAAAATVAASAPHNHHAQQAQDYDDAVVVPDSVLIDSPFVDEDSAAVVPVVGCYELQDTTTYTAVSQESDVADGDTTVRYRVDTNFRLAVADSTADGYTLHLLVQSCNADSSCADNFKARLHEAGISALKGTKVVVGTDFAGQVTEIKNWQEVGKLQLRAYERIIDSTFAANPEMGKVVKRDAMKGLYSKMLATEEGVRGTLAALQVMFANHGNQFTAGQEECDTVAATSDSPGYTLTRYADYGVIDSTDTETEFEGDYFVLGNVSTMVDGKDIAPLLAGAISGLVNQKGGLSAKKIEKEMQNVNSIEVENDSKCFYYYNGWPKITMFTTTTTMGPVKRIKAQMVASTSFSWGNH